MKKDKWLNRMKKILFISYTSENYNKVDLIKEELKDNLHFKPLVVANHRKPNKALIKKVTEGIDSSFGVIPLLTKESIYTQWINQEIGYANGKDIPVIPIVEKRILLDLKGFINSQNDIPYQYESKPTLFFAEEQESFRTQFRQLIRDLERDYLKIIINDEKKSRGPMLQEELFLTDKEKTVPIGTKIKGGEICPRTGMWRNSRDKRKEFLISEGSTMPSYINKVAIWELLPQAN